MKRIVKRNQVIITSLVIMIIVAGYLNFTADKVTTTGTQGDLNNETMTSEVLNTENNTLAEETLGSTDVMADISEEDQIVDVAVPPEEDMSTLDESETGVDVAAAGTGEDDVGDVENIGEAVLTSSAAASSFSASAKLNREQTRSKNQATLMEVINNANVTEEAKQEAINSLTRLNEVAENELAAETLLEAKGFSHSVVSMTADSVDVVICLNSLTETQKAQIEDIVTRKTGMEADKIVITTLKSE